MGLGRTKVVGAGRGSLAGTMGRVPGLTVAVKAVVAGSAEKPSMGD